MKLHLPFALLAAVVSAVAYAEEGYTIDRQTGKDYKDKEAQFEFNGEVVNLQDNDVTVNITGGNFSGYNMGGSGYEHYLPNGAVLGGSATDIIDGTKLTTYNDIYIEVSGDDTYIPTLIGESTPTPIKITGDKNIIINGGTIDSLIGGSSYVNGSSGKHGFNKVNNPISYGGTTAFLSHKDESNPDINITVKDGTIGQIRGGHNGSSQAKLYNKLDEAAAKDKLLPENERHFVADLMANKPWSVAGNININVEAGKITGTDGKAILGAGGNGFSVDGAVNITIGASGTTGPVINGYIMAGSTNLYTEVDSTNITINSGTINGNVYGGGDYDKYAAIDDKGFTNLDRDYLPTVKKNTNITITGGTIDGNVYGAGIRDIVKGGTCITLLGGTITGGVYGGGTDDSSVVEGEKILYVGNADQEFTGSVGWVEGFTQVIVSKGSSLKMDAGNVFEVNEQIITLSSANLMEAAMSGGFALVGEKGLTLTILAGEALASGKYKLVELSENNKLRAATTSGPQGWDESNVTINGIGGFNDTTWEGNILYFIYKQWNVDAAIVSNWGVFKSSQAFTGTLWGNRSNAVVLGSPAGTNDGKAPVAIAEQPATTLAWASAYGQSGRISNAGADYSLYGAAMGIERQFGAKGSSIGVAFGYDWGKVSPFTTTSADQETWHAALYGRAGAWKAGKGIVSVDWSVAYGDTTTEHNEYTSDWSQDSWQFDVRATYAQALSERATASVFAGVQYYTHDDATVDNMHISSLQNLRLTAGAGLNYAATARTNVYGQASLYFDAMRHNPHVDTNGACFHGTNPGRIGGVLSLGADYAISEQWTLRGGYSFDAAKDSTEHNVNAGVQYSF